MGDDPFTSIERLNDKPSLDEPSLEELRETNPGFVTWLAEVDDYVETAVIEFCEDYDRALAAAGKSERLMDSAIHPPLKDAICYLSNWKNFPAKAVTNNGLAVVISSLHEQSKYNMTLLPELLADFVRDTDTVYLPLMERTVPGWQTMTGDERAMMILGAWLINTGPKTTIPKIPEQPQG